MATVLEPRLGYAEFPSPVDTLRLVFAGESLIHLDFADNGERMRKALRRRFNDWTPENSALPESIAAPLEAYFAGEWAATVRLAFISGGTPFQRAVWRALLAVEPGTTTTYAALAEAAGKDATASRAVGAAVGSNPLSIVVPCHRVIGANGRLTGYAGGIARKRWLLRHEGIQA